MRGMGTMVERWGRREKDIFGEREDVRRERGGKKGKEGSEKRERGREDGKNMN